jgi:hypothetical protein
MSAFDGNDGETVGHVARLSQILELLETVVLLTGFDSPVGDVHQMDWLVCWNGKSVDPGSFPRSGG